MKWQSWFVHLDLFAKVRKRCFCNIEKQPPKVFLKFPIIHRKTPTQESFFNRLATLLKKRLHHRCFPMNFTKFLRTAFLQYNSDCFWISFFMCSTVFSVSLIRQFVCTEARISLSLVFYTTFVWKGVCKIQRKTHA